MRIFFTGYPGFIGGRIVRAMAERHPGATFQLLVEPRLERQARARLERDGLADRSEVVLGDLVRPDCGIDDAASVLADVTQVWHLAAIYDLAVPAERAERVNVDGTAHVLDLCEKLPKLDRLVYFSTCYVAGDRSGTVREDELDVGQGFKNHYESTKFRAERDVQQRMERVPSTIVRPAVVVGDSRTGETDKYDGPYPFLQALIRLPGRQGLPMIGKGSAPLNVVPIDYVVDAVVTLAELDEAEGRVFHLADPEPMTAAEIMAEAHRILDKKQPRLHVPHKLGDLALRVGPLRRQLGMPREALDYLEGDVRFDTTNARRVLGPADVRCPPLRTYLPVLIDYVKTHPTKAFLVEHRL